MWLLRAPLFRIEDASPGDDEVEDEQGSRAAGHSFSARRTREEAYSAVSYRSLIDRARGGLTSARTAGRGLHEYADELMP